MAKKLETDGPALKLPLANLGAGDPRARMPRINHHDRSGRVAVASGGGCAGPSNKKVVQNLTHLQQVSGKALECLLELQNGSRVVEAVKKA